MTANEERLQQLPDAVPDRGPEWLVGLRRSAAEHLRERGFPTKKTEAWRFTPVEPLARTSFAPAPDPAERARTAGEAAAHLGDDGTGRVLLADGMPVLEAAGDLPEGVQVRSLREVLDTEPALVEGHLGRHAPQEDFAALNAALFEDGVVVHVRDGATVERPLHLVHVGLAGDSPTASYPRVLVIAGRNAQARIVETFLVHGDAAEHLTNVVTEVCLEEAAIVDHVRINHGTDNGLHTGALAVHQHRGSVYRSQVITLGGALSRLDLRAELAGEGAECHLEGVYHVRGNEHVDHHTRIDHAEPRCSSTQVYRGVLDDRGHAVFDGTVVVRPHAQHTEAHQENRNLLLSDEAAVNTKPHLEIEADDVKCSHGATIGSLDEAQLYYLRGRGIGLEQARALLIYSFVRELVDRVPHEPLRHRLAEAILDRLPHGDVLRELA